MTTLRARVRVGLMVIALLAAVSIILPVSAQNPINLFFGATPASVNSGTKDGGTLRVTIATDQTQLTNALKVDGSAVTQPVSGTFWQATQPVSGTFWQATQPISAVTLPLMTGAATATKQDDQATLTGAVTEAAPASDTASSGLNGRLQRIAQRLTSLIALLPTSLSNGFFKVSVQEKVAVKQVFGTAQTVINTASNVTSGSVSGAPAATYDNTSDASYPQAMKALAVAVFPTWGGTPVLGTTVDLCGVIQDVDSTSDETDAPTGSNCNGAHYFGSWTVAASTSLQRRALTIDVTGYQKIDFYVWNRTAQTLTCNGGTNCTVKITPLANN